MLGAVISVLLIWVITGILVYAAILRITTMDFEVESDTMIIVAAIGVVINIMWVMGILWLIIDANNINPTLNASKIFVDIENFLDY